MSQDAARAALGLKATLDRGHIRRQRARLRTECLRAFRRVQRPTKIEYFAPSPSGSRPPVELDHRLGRKTSLQAHPIAVVL